MLDEAISVFCVSIETKSEIASGKTTFPESTRNSAMTSRLLRHSSPRTAILPFHLPAIHAMIGVWTRTPTNAPIVGTKSIPR
jgi:hypothetical protein